MDHEHTTLGHHPSVMKWQHRRDSLAGGASHGGLGVRVLPSSSLTQSNNSFLSMASHLVYRLSCVFVACIATFALGAGPLNAAQARPNVVFIAIDDLNDWVGILGGNPDAKTPNMDRLAGRGMLFTNAHCQVPVCMASRVSVMSGKLASTTGCYEFNAEFHEAPSLAQDVPIPLAFKQQGYRTLGGGKLLHNGFLGRLADTFEVKLEAGRNPGPKTAMNWPVRVWDYGPFPERDEEMGDYQLAQKAAEHLRRKHAEPFFLAVGFHRPHVPFYVPQKWFDLYDAEKLTLPKAPPDDMNDIPESDVTRTKGVAPSHAEVLAAGKWRGYVHAYLASVSFVDYCVGIVADAVAAGPNRDDTLIVLWSDHGFHLGEKQHWAKRTLWAESTRVPLMICGPGIQTGRRTHAPAALLDLYPTLNELCGIPSRPGLEGRSLVPLLKDPDAPWDRAVVSTWLPNNHSIVDRQWRYIRYADGSEELYNHQTDPDEFTNLAAEARFARVKAQLARSLPTTNAPLVQFPRKAMAND